MDEAEDDNEAIEVIEAAHDGKKLVKNSPISHQIVHFSTNVRIMSFWQGVKWRI